MSKFTTNFGNREKNLSQLIVQAVVNLQNGSIKNTIEVLPLTIDEVLILSNDDDFFNKVISEFYKKSSQLQCVLLFVEILAPKG